MPQPLSNPSLADIELVSISTSSAPATAEPQPIVNDLSSFLFAIDQIDRQLLDTHHRITNYAIRHTDSSDHIPASTHCEYEQVRSSLDWIGRSIQRLELDAARVTTKASSDRKIVYDQLIKVGRKYRDLVATYHEFETQYQEKTRHDLARQIRVVQPGITPTELNLILDNRRAPMHVFALHSHNTLAQHVLDEVLDRQSILAEIAQQVDELAELMVQVARLIDEQDTRLDLIFERADALVEDLHKATDQVVLAKHYRLKNIKMLWFLCVAVILLIVGILLWVFLGTSAGRQAVGGSNPQP